MDDAIKIISINGEPVGRAMIFITVELGDNLNRLFFTITDKLSGMSFWIKVITIGNQMTLFR